jgi:hypothetical protein
MREFLTSNQFGNIEFNQNRALRESITKRWESVGMTDGLTGVI